MIRLVRALFRRVFWFTTGASMGFGGAMWIRNRIRRAMARVAPERVSQDVTSGARKVGTDVREALAEGRAAMRAREAELRHDLAPGGR